MGAYGSAVARFKPNPSNNHIFTVSKATGSKLTQFTPPSGPSMQVKSFSTIKESTPPQMIDFQKGLFKQPKADGGSLAQWAIRCLFPSFQPNPLSKKIMGMFGFNPETAVECPILSTAPIDQLEQLVSVACPKKGSIYTGWIDLSKYGKGDAHFYIVAANCGNIHAISAMTGVPVETVRAKITAPLAVFTQWAGCMMAGGGTIQLNSESEAILKQMADGEKMDLQKIVIGKGDLTVGRDQVELSRPERILTGGASLFSFLARTMYFHALSGSVQHNHFVAANGDIFWVWVGAGGRGFNSKEINNFTAIDLDLGMWPDLAKALMKFYEDPTLMKLFLEAEAENHEELIKQIVAASKGKRGTLMDLLQRVQVTMGFGKRVKDTVNHGALKVRGED
jgi:hypothetical protein